MNSSASWHLAIVQCLWKSRVINSVYCRSMFTPWVSLCSLHVVYSLATGTNWYCATIAWSKKAVSVLFIMDLLYRAFCGLGPMVLTDITNITASFKHRDVPIPTSFHPVIINLMKFSSAWHCCKRSVQIFRQFDFRSAGRWGLNIEATRSVHRFSMRPVDF